MERKVNEYLRDFPILQTKMNGRPIVYLDNGATTQKPETVIRASLTTVRTVTRTRTAARMSSRSRRQISMNGHACARSSSSVQRVRRRSYSQRMRQRHWNLVAYSYGLANVREGDEIVITISEHHSNIVPWQFVAKSRGAVLKYIYLGEDGNLSEADIAQQITERTKIVAVTQVSNVLGLVNDVRRRCRPRSCGRCSCRCRRLAERAAHQGGCAGDGCGFLAFSGA